MRFTRLVMTATCVIAASSCYTQRAGTAPPTNLFYFPVGLATSRGGNLLYAVNSDFDLQYSGGTLQSYDLFTIRRHAAELVSANLTGGTPPADIPFVNPWMPGCHEGAGQQGGLPLGETCAPPVRSASYVLRSAVIGAFATDLQLSVSGTRLFMPVRGDASLTWADVAADDPNATSADGTIQCDQLADGRCDANHHAGNNPDEIGNTRHLAMPGEPFGMAQSEDGSAIVITHQTDTKTSLFCSNCGDGGHPAMEFVLDGMPTGGNGITAVPHDPDAAPASLRPAFLQTSRANAELDLLRYYSDDESVPQDSSSVHRPFIQKETAYALTANAGGNDSRGIVIDRTPRLACKAKAQSDADKKLCGQRPARVFFANRTPASMVYGEIGELSPLDGTYDPDRLVILGNVPLSAGPSKIYMAPIVDAAGNYELRLFIVCFDASTIFVYDPDTQAVESVVYTGPGPFAMAFDPFSIDDVAARKPAAPDGRYDASLGMKRYRFAYVASFTQSYVQLIDLDGSQPSRETFERVVYTLGNPTPPKGS